MKRFRCQCGQRVFFENLHCLRCGRQLGFDPDTRDLVALEQDARGVAVSAGGIRYRHCRNRIDYGICNWLVGVEEHAEYCVACRLNAVIPNLTVPGNLALWARVEGAKRRLIYDLLGSGLPLEGDAQQPALSFRFLEDQRRNALVEESFVATGHYDGTITINLAEAEDSVRHAVRERMQERYRTLLGHLRHESGHFYFEALIPAENAARAGFRELFGDERLDYQRAIEAHYDDRTRSTKADDTRYVSSYAASHPLEDWAETWAHSLHIVDGLETAAACGLCAPVPIEPASPDWIYSWLEVSVTLNELSRGLGVDDPYPFVLSPAVVEKLMFVRRRVAQAAAQTAASAAR